MQAKTFWPATIFVTLYPIHIYIFFLFIFACESKFESICKFHTLSYFYKNDSTVMVRIQQQMRWIWLYGYLYAYIDRVEYMCRKPLENFKYWHFIFLRLNNCDYRQKISTAAKSMRQSPCKKSSFFSFFRSLKNATLYICSSIYGIMNGKEVVEKQRK